MSAELSDVDEPGTGSTIDHQAVEGWRRDIAGRLSSVRDRLDRAGGRDVKLLAVSKGQPIEAVVGARELGIDEFGENYAQELAAKAGALADHRGHKGDAQAPHQPTWHFIGQLQRNKVRQVAHAVTVWQSVDRLRVATEIAKRAPQARAFAQVNLAEDQAKAGCSFEELPALVDGMHDLGLVVQGVMGVGTAADDEATAAGFRRLRSLADQLGLAECSMGMSGDLELAVGEGSTMVRVGTAIFGPRR